MRLFITKSISLLVLVAFLFIPSLADINKKSTGSSSPEKLQNQELLSDQNTQVSNRAAASRNFEAYSNMDWIGSVDNEWSTWGGSTGSYANGDAQVSTDYANSGTKSVKLENVATDALFLMGDQTTGSWGTGFSMYIPTGSSGYYNIQETEAPGTRWVVEIFMDNGGTGTVEFGTNVIPFTYPQGQWFDVRHYCDLDNDSIVVYIDGTFIGGSSYTHNGGTTTLGSFDFYPDGAAGPTKLHYIDDMYYQPAAIPIGDRSFDSYANTDWIASMDNEWSTWGGSTGSYANGDAQVSTDFAKSGANSVKLENAATDALFLMGDVTTGTWGNGFSMYVPTGSSGYYNIQETEAPGTRWVVEVFMDNSGTGTVEFGTNVIPFSYPQGQWFDVRHYCDLDNDSIQVWINGIFVGAESYTHNGGTTTLGSFDFYPDGASGPTKLHYIDDMYYQPASMPANDRSFELYNNMDWVASSDSEWSTWGGSTGSYANGDAQVSTDFAQSGTKSLKLENAATDALFLMGDVTAGVWGNGFSMYVPSGSSGYYNIQETEAPGTRWVVEVFMDNGGTGTVEFGTNVIPFTYPQDAWFDVRQYCDLDNDSIQVWIDGNFVGGTTYTHNGGTTTLGSFDFYPDGAAGPTKLHYIDDMYYQLDSIRSTGPVQSRSFEAHSDGDWVGDVNTEWSTWGGSTGSYANGDALISTEQANSGSNSVKLENVATDALFLMGDVTTGTWGNGFSMYVPTGSSGYYNIQETEAPGTRWVVEIFMDDGGTGTVEFGTNVIPFSYPQDAWFDVRHYCDLDNDSIQVWIDGQYVGATSYTHNGGTTTLGSFDFYPDGASGPSKVHYVDDIYYQPDSIRATGPVQSRSFEAHMDGAWVGEVNTEWSTWGGSTGSYANGDAIISTEQANSGSNSVKLENASTDALFLMGDVTTGTWGNGFSMYVPTGSSGYYNIQETEAPGTRWVVEIFMDDGGTGTVEFGTNVIPFTYPQDQWFNVRQYCDLDNDSIQVFIDGNYVGATSYTHNGGTTTLGSFDFYPDGASGPSKVHYVDDMFYQPDSIRNVVGLKDNLVENNVSIYPNPAQDKLMISVGSINVISVEIRNMIGQKVLQFETVNSNNVFDISELRDGMYLVRILAEEGEFTQKLLVK